MKKILQKEKILNWKILFQLDYLKYSNIWSFIFFILEAQVNWQVLMDKFLIRLFFHFKKTFETFKTRRDFEFLFNLIYREIILWKSFHGWTSIISGLLESFFLLCEFSVALYMIDYFEFLKFFSWVIGLKDVLWKEDLGIFIVGLKFALTSCRGFTVIFSLSLTYTLY